MFFSPPNTNRPEKQVFLILCIYIVTKDDDDDDYGTASTNSKSTYNKYGKEKNVAAKHQESKYEKSESEPDDDQSFVPHQKPMSSVPEKSTKPRAPSPSSPQHAGMVYIPDLPSDRQDNHKLETLIDDRIEDLLQVKPKKVKCYSKLGIGVIYVTDNRLKDRLLNKIGKLALDPKEGKYSITFVETIELISYIVLEVADELKEEELPTTKEIARRWVELHKGEKPVSCDILNAQFPNIYRVVSSTLDELINTSSNGVFSIKKF